MRTYSTNGGAKQFAGWWDDELETECSPGLAEDGRMSCLPVSSHQPGNGELYFNDQNCDSEILAILTIYCGTGIGKFLRTANYSPCFDYRNSVYFAGSEYTGQDVFIRSGTDCVQSQRSESYIYYHAIKVPPSTFIEFTETID